MVFKSAFSFNKLIRKDVLAKYSESMLPLRDIASMEMRTNLSFGKGCIVYSYCHGRVSRRNLMELLKVYIVVGNDTN